MDHPANAGLNVVFDILQPAKEAFPAISWADLLQMASATAIELAGGPIIPMRYGRIDVNSPSMCHPVGASNLPHPAGPWKLPPEDHLREVFYRMGFTDKEIVVLSGAHTLGRVRPERSGFGKEVG